MSNIKTRTPNFKFLIPEFNTATWHDELEQNFRSIDALFYNLFGINGFSGIWKTDALYTVGQVLFIGEDNGSKYEGRLVKIVHDTNTGGFSTFSEAISANPSDYEIFSDASTAQIYAELAKDWANKTTGTIITPKGEDTGEYSAKYYQKLAKDSEGLCNTYKNSTNEYMQSTLAAKDVTIAQAQDAKTSATNAKNSETLAKTSEDNALNYKNSAQDSATSAQKSAQDAATSATAATNAANDPNVQTVAANISAINTCSSNIAAIKDAPTQAERAKQYADQAQSVTEGTLNETHITNCITEIPQDIKLELSNGTLILKAGSKIYVKGDTTTPTYTIPSDKTTTQTTNGSYFAFYDGTNLVTYLKTKYDYTTLPTTTSLPIAEITVSNNKISNIDQVFNGFGYIGSTVFALPGVKGLIPNGRNEDGTLRSIEFVNNKVKISTNTGNERDWFVYDSLGNFDRVSSTAYKYDNNKNKIITIADNTDKLFCVCGTSIGNITSIVLKTTFHAIDFFDFKVVKDDMMTLSTNQTVLGNKKYTGKNVFYGDERCQFILPNIDISTSPDVSQLARPIQIKDKNEQLVGYIGISQFSNGEVSTHIGTIINTTEGGTIYPYLKICGNLSGEQWVETQPPTSATDNSNKVPTTSWVHEFLTNKKPEVVGWCVPDYTAGVAISGITTANTSFSVPKDGILYIKMSSISFLGSVFVDDMVACSLANASAYNGISVSFMPISKGAHTFRSENVAATANITFYPFKGA